MIAFRANGARLLPALLCLLVAPSFLAMAQEGVQDNAGKPVSLFPAPAEPAPEIEPEPERRPARAPKDIEVDQLDTAMPESVGVLDPGESGFGFDLWRGSDRDSIERLIGLLPRRIESPTLRDLTRQLLLSSAAPPQGETGDAAALQGLGLLLLRAEMLLALRDVAGLQLLMPLVPQAANAQEPVARMRVEADLLSGERERACQRIRNGIERYATSAFWQKGMIYCQILSGDETAATLSLDLLREQGEDEGIFVALAAAALGYGDPPEVSDESPLILAMTLLAGSLPLPAVLEESDAGLPAVLLRTADLGVQQRLAFAERAALAGALPPQELAEHYLSAAFDGAKLANALDVAPELGGAWGRALLYQAAARQPDPAARAEILSVLFLEAAVDGRERAIAQAALPLLEAVPASPEVSWFAPAAIRAFILAGRSRQAAQWLPSARRSAVTSEETKLAMLRLWPLVRIAGLESLAEDRDLGGWGRALRAVGDDPDWVAGQQSFVRAMLQAVGEMDPMPWVELVQQQAAEGAYATSAAAVQALRVAAENGRLGECLLLVLLVLGGDGPASSHTLVLGDAIEALTRVGQMERGRVLAVEAMAARGL